MFSETGRHQFLPISNIREMTEPVVRDAVLVFVTPPAYHYYIITESIVITTHCIYVIILISLVLQVAIVYLLYIIGMLLYVE